MLIFLDGDAVVVTQVSAKISNPEVSALCCRPVFAMIKPFMDNFLCFFLLLGLFFIL